MDIFEDLDEAILGGFQTFKEFIRNKLREDKDLLHKTFWSRSGKQMTLLNYLIINHNQNEENLDLKPFINHILKKGADITVDQPLHLAFELNKTDLIPLLLAIPGLPEARVIHGHDELRNSQQKIRVDHRDLDEDRVPDVFHNEVNSRDKEGRSLLSRAIEAKDIEALNAVLFLKPNVNQSNALIVEEKKRDVQPLHQAVINNFDEGVKALIQAGAQIDNPFGTSNKTALLIAAAYGHVDSLAVILESANHAEQLNREDKFGDRAIDLLCKRLEQNKGPIEAIRGVAMLLCRGAEPPRSEKWCQLLQSYRAELMTEVKNYTNKYPKLSPNFVRAAHDKNNSLHSIVYAVDTWSKSAKHFFGMSDDMAMQLEELVKLPELGVEQDENYKFTEDELKFAQFVTLYNQAYKGNSLFGNPWSEMRLNISKGKITTWKQVLDYAQSHENSRTARVVKEMLKQREPIHIDMEEYAEHGSSINFK